MSNKITADIENLLYAEHDDQQKDDSLMELTCDECHKVVDEFAHIDHR